VNFCCVDQLTTQKSTVYILPVVLLVNGKHYTGGCFVLNQLGGVIRLIINLLDLDLENRLNLEWLE